MPRPPLPNQKPEPPPPPRSFLGIHFTCCNLYSRIYKTADGSAYAGNCPKCGARVKVAIGEGGSSGRFFTAR